ncbi:MAG: alpha/beta fold hydrolase [Xanthobacteraceae bacterium]
MPRIDIGAITLNYTEAGRGEPLLFIPGLVGLYTAWDYQMAHFSQRYRCITFDHRGAGDSDKPAGNENYSTRVLAEDVVALLDALGIDKVSAIGTSTGGCVLQNLALDHPQRLARCVFSNTWTKADIYVQRVQTLRKWIAQSYGTDAYVEFSSILTNGPMQFRHNLDRVMEIETRSKETIGSVDVIAARIDMTLTHDRLAELDRIDCPSLIIGTQDDATVPAYFADDLHAAIKGSRLVIFPEGGHYSYRLKADEWNAIVGEFLADTKPG